MAGSIISLIIIKESQGYDITELVESVTWQGRKGSSARSLKAVLVDDDGYKHARSGIDVEQGHQCIFSVNGAEVFRGIIMSQTQTQAKKLTFTAYDNGIYLANNEDTFCYENKTATDVFLDCCARLGTKSKTSAWDAIADALSLDYNATGIRHYISSTGGALNLLIRKENIIQFVISVGENMTAYSYTRSIEDVKTRVKLVSKGGTTLAEKTNSALEEKIGIFQTIDTPDEALKEAQIKDLVTSILAEQSTPARTLTVESIGIPDVISGIGVFIMIPALGISQTFYVDEDTHTFTGNKHLMKLKLNYASDI